MKLSKTMKKVLAYICALAMVVTSMTGYQARISAAEDGAPTWEIQQGEGGFQPSEYGLDGFEVTGIPASGQAWEYGARIWVPTEAGTLYELSLTAKASVDKVLVIEGGSNAASKTITATPEGTEVNIKFTGINDAEHPGMSKMYIRLGYDAANDTAITEPFDVTISDVKITEAVDDGTIKFTKHDIRYKLGDATRMVDLYWEPVSGADRYRVRANGKQVQDANAALYKKDITCEPGKTLEVTVIALDKDKNEGTSSTINIDIPALTAYEQAYLDVANENKAKEDARKKKLTTAENLAKGAEVIVPVPDADPKAQPSVMTDGNTGTRWQASTTKGTEDQLENSVVEVNMGTVKNVGSIMIAWQNSCATKYDVYVAGVDHVYGDTPIAQGEAAAPDPVRSHDLAENVDVQYIKIVPTELSGNAVQYGISIWEIGTFADATSIELTPYPNPDDYPEETEKPAETTTEKPAETTTEATVETTTEAPTEPVQAGDVDLTDDFWSLQLPGGGFEVSEYNGTGFTVSNIPAGTDKWACGALLENVAVTKGETYTMTLKVKSTVDKVVPIEFTNGTAINRVVNATAEGTEFSIKFTAREDKVKIYMPLGVDAAIETVEDAYSITISDVQFEITEPDPTEETTILPVDKEITIKEPVFEFDAATLTKHYRIDWNAVEGATAYTAYVDVEDEYHIARAFHNGYLFENRGGTSVDHIKGVPGDVSKLIVVAYDADNKLIARGIKEINTPELTESEQEMVKLVTKMNSADNYAKGATAFVSSGNGAESIVDGNLGSKWQANPADDSHAVNSEYFGVNLGEVKKIGQVAIVYEAACAAKFDIYVAGADEVYGETPVASGTADGKNLVSKVDFDAVDAQFVKVVVTEFSELAQTWGTSAFEIAVFGEAGTDVPGTTVAPTTTEEATEAPAVDPITPFGLDVKSPEAGKITVVWGQNDEMITNGQKYNVLVDEVVVLTGVTCASYTIDATPGEHTVSVVAVLGDKVSEAASATVTVEKVEEKVTWEIQQGEAWESSTFDYNGFTVTDIPANAGLQWKYGARIVAPIVEAEKTYNVTLKFTSTVNKYLYIELGSDTTEVVATPEGAEVTVKLTTGADLLKMYVRLGYDPAKDTEVTEAYSVTLDEVKVEELDEAPLAKIEMGEPTFSVVLGDAFQLANLSWTAYEGAAKYKAYYQYDGNVAVNNVSGFKFDNLTTQTDVKNIKCTADGTPNRIIVYAYDAAGNKIARGIKEFVAPELTPYQKACAEVAARNEAKEAERLANLNTELNFAKGAEIIPVAEDANPQNMVDGDMASSWQASSTKKLPDQIEKSVIEINLGEVKTIGSVLIAWQNAYATKYDIYAGDAEHIYGDEPIITYTLSGENPAPISHDLTDKVEAQWIKLVPRELKTNAVNYGIRIFEIGVFADATSVVLEEMPKEEDFTTTQAPTTTEAPSETETESSTEAPTKPEVEMKEVVGTGVDIKEGNWTVWINTTNTMKMGSNGDYLVTSIVSNQNNWDQWGAVQYKYIMNDLEPNKQYTLSLTLNATKSDGILAINDGKSVSVVEGDTALTIVKTADANGMADFVIGAGQVGIGVELTFSGLTVKDADGNVVYPKEEETTTPGETSTEAPTDETTTPGETSTEDPTDETTTPGETTTEKPSTPGETTTGAENTTTPKQDVTTVAPTKVKAPGKAKIKKVNAKKLASKAAKLSLKKINGAKGYQVAIYKTKKLAKKNKKALVKKFVKKVKATVKSKKLKNKKALFVRVRAYALADGKKVYGKWSKVKKVKVK